MDATLTLNSLSEEERALKRRGDNINEEKRVAKRRRKKFTADEFKLLSEEDRMKRFKKK